MPNEIFREATPPANLSTAPSIPFNALMTASLLEIAVATVADAVRAVEAGADRLELSCALACGGLTPSLGTFLQIRPAVDVPILVLLRPRAGGFAYSPADFDTLRRDLDLFRDHGADGFVVGVLTDQRAIDVDRCAQLLRQAGPSTFVFHRAFDMLAKPLDALDQLVKLGFRRVLTSGCERFAWEGAAMLRRLHNHAQGRIEILPAAGIGPENAAGILQATGCTQLHASARRRAKDPALHGFDWLGLGTPSADECEETDANKVRALRRALDRYYERNEKTSPA